MNATAIITFSITVAGFVFTMITLVGLKNNVSNLTSTCQRIEAKLDRLIEKESRQ